MRRQDSQRAKFAHTIDMPQGSQRNLNIGQQTQEEERKDDLDSQRPVSGGSRESDIDSGAKSPSWPPGEEDGEQEAGVLDALSSFRCNGQAVVPSMPASSYIAQLNVAEQEEDRRQEEEEAQQAGEARTDASLRGNEAQPPPGRGRQLGDVSDEVMERHTGNLVNPVTGRVTGQAAQPSLVERLMEGVGLGGSSEDNERKEEEKQQSVMEAVVSDHPELSDGGQHATVDEEDKKDAAVFSPGDQTAGDQPATADSSSAPTAQSAQQTSSSPPSTNTSAPATNQFSPPGQPSTRRDSTRSSAFQPPQKPPTSPKVDYAKLDPYNNHIVVCGYIDSKIINFLRRLRDSDSRTVVLVFDNSVCFPLPPAVHAFIVSHFENVYILFASNTYKARHQKEKLYLAYTSPCYGHHHEPPMQVEKSRRPLSAVDKGATVDGAPSELLSGGAVTQPPLAMDEHSEIDKRVHHALHLSGEVHGQPIKGGDHESSKYRSALADRRRSTSVASNNSDDRGDTGESGSQPFYPKVAAYSLSITGVEGSKPMTYEEMLQHGSWFRRACVHRADSVLILANPYSSPAGSASSSSTTDNPQAGMTQHLLASVLNATERQSHSTDEMLKADQFGLTIYSGVQAYLQQCRTAACPSLSMRVTATSFSIVNIELIHHANVRLLKHDADATERYRPTQAVEAGWRWVWDAAKHWYAQHKEKSQVGHEKADVRKALKKQRQSVKRRHYAMMRGVALKDEAKLDRHSTDDSSNRDDDEGENDEQKDRGGEVDDTDQQSAMDQSLREEDARFAKTLQDHFRAFYTADGLMFSGKILDALIVQAFFHPLVYDTVVSLVSGYAHTIPEQQFQRAMDERDSVTDDGRHGHGDDDSDADGGGGGRGEGEGGGHSDPNDRTFRVELLLVDVPEVMAGRTYGFLALKLMLENGWVPLGLYRDRRAVVRLRQKTRLKVMLLDMQQRKGDERKVDKKKSKRSSRRHSHSKPQPAEPVKPAQPPSRAASRPPSAAASRRASTTSQSTQLTKGSSKGKSAIEMAEQQRRMQTFHVTGLSASNVNPRPSGDDMTAKQREEERRTEHLARRSAKLHHKHPHSHSHSHSPNQSPPETANVNTLTTDTGSGSNRLSGEQPSVSDTFTVQVATTLAKDGDGSTRAHHHHHHHHHHDHHDHGKQGTTALGTHTERGGEYDADDDADHLDTSARQHRDMTKLRQDTFDPPAHQKQLQQSVEEKRRERAENSTVRYARTDSEGVTKAQQDYLHQEPHKHTAGATTDNDEYCSSSSLCSSAGSSDDGSDEAADDAELTNTPYTSRSLFYVLTNPPPDTILHARDRLYVLVQRWIKPASVHRMLHGQTMKEAEEAVNRDEQEQQQRAARDDNSNISRNVTPNTASSTEGPQPVAAEAMTFPRTYSGNGQPDISDPLQQQPSNQPSPHGHGGGEQSVVTVLQQQLVQQQQMLQLIQRQLADLARAQGGQKAQRPPKWAHSQSSPGTPGHFTPPALDNAGSSQLTPNAPSFPSANSRYQLPAEDEGVAFELERFMADRPNPMQHPSLRRSHSTLSSLSTAPSQSPSQAPANSGTLAPIAGAARFGRPATSRRVGSSGHISITDASPSHSHSSTSLPPQYRTVSATDYSSMLPLLSTTSGMVAFSSSSSLFSPTSLTYGPSSNNSQSYSSAEPVDSATAAMMGSTTRGSSSSLSLSPDSALQQQQQAGQPYTLPPQHR